MVISQNSFKNNKAQGFGMIIQNNVSAITVFSLNLWIFYSSLQQQMYENIQENSSMFLFNHICKKKKNNLGYAKFSSGLHKNKKNAMLPTPESSWNSEYDQKLKANIFKMHNILLIV